MISVTGTSELLEDTIQRSNSLSSLNLTSECCIIREKRPEKAFKMFSSLISCGIQGFVISREHPGKLRKRYMLDKTPLIWLSRSGTDSAISPNNLWTLLELVSDFTKKNKGSVILLDGLEYLSVQIGFGSVLTHLSTLKTIILESNSRLIISISSDAFSAVEYITLLRTLEFCELDSHDS